MATTSEQLEPSIGTHAPIIVDLGKQGRKSIKALRRGEGRLMADVTRCIQDLQDAGTLSPSAQPVIIIVRQKRRQAVMWPLG